MTRALVRPVWRTLPRRALAAAAATGLLLAGVPRMQSGAADPVLGLYALRGAALALALGLAFLLDDPARHVTSAVPARRPVRIGLRVALVAPWAALCWTAALLLVPREARPPVGAVTLEAAVTAVFALTAAALAVRRPQVTEPGVAVSAWLLSTAVAAALLPHGDWALLVVPDDPRWDSSHERWAVLLALATALGARACVEPLRAGWRPPLLKRQAPAAPQ
ncbi:ABC transporter [Streptomyces sp. Qhu-G9]|uniref:ABC transporter n=1 Tax=Streptomyces sp. Qhu-G9 TaxID=3452799 RepID=UPI0022AC0070|nr:ABC transporter [Streptomyces aurantiacus]WAU85848.1 ABC transporter [Streptomyces aurantiacus]